MTDTLANLRADIKRKLDERARHQDNLDRVMRSAERGKREHLTEREQRDFDDARDAIRQIDGALDALESRKQDIEEMRSRNADREALARRLQPDPDPITIRVGHEPGVYRPGGEHSWFRDAIAAARGDRMAAERIDRQQVVDLLEARDVNTGNFGALIVPQYLPEAYAEVLRSGRVTMNICNNLPLPPEGMTLNIPRGTTGTAVAAQSDENTAVQETDFDETTLTVNVRTYAGMQDVSRQSWERGTNVDSVIYADLASAYSTKVNQDVINGAGTNGTHLGILQTSGVSTVTCSGTAGQTQSFVIRKLHEAIATVNTNRFMPATGIIMHPRRWGWLASGADSNGRPFVLPAGDFPQNAFGVGELAAYGMVGQLAGLPVWTDGGIPTTLSSSTFSGSTEDTIIVTRRQDLLLWEESVAPRRFTFEETLGGQLTVRVVAAGYSAFTAGYYPQGTIKLTGSTLTTPTF